MQDSDIALIERELDIKLPESYKKTVVPFRIRALAGNTQYELWDDATRLIEVNKRLRAGSRTRATWPAHLFAVGDPHGDEMIALDTRSAVGPVWWLDHGMVQSKASYQSHPKFAEWADEFYRDVCADLEDSGEDPNGEPIAEERMTRWGALLYLFSLVGIAVVGFAILLGIHWVRKWLKHH